MATDAIFPRSFGLRRLAIIAVSCGASFFLPLVHLGADSAETTPHPSIEVPAPGDHGTTPVLSIMQAPESMHWPTSGVFRGDQMLFADVLKQRVIAVDPAHDDGIVGIVDLDAPSDDQLPADLSEIRAMPDGSGYLIEDEGHRSGGDRLIRVNNDFEVLPALTLKVDGRELVDGWLADVVYDWQPTMIDGVLGILAFADLKRQLGGGEEWTSALIFFDENDRSLLFDRFDINSDTSFQHTQGRGYLATTGQFGHMLVYRSPDPYLLRVDLAAGGDSTVVELPEQLRSRVAVKPATGWKRETTGPERHIAYLEALEQHSGVERLLARGDQLFLVFRAIEPPNFTWAVYSLDAASQWRAIDRIAMSGDTGHLVVAQDESKLGLLEQAKVQRIGVNGWNAPHLRARKITVYSSDLLLAEVAHPSQ